MKGGADMPIASCYKDEENSSCKYWYEKTYRNAVNDKEFKIMTAWKEQNWKKPEFDFSERSDRVILKLEVGQVVYIPGVADIRNENANQVEQNVMSKEEKILEYIRQNGSISTQKVMDLCNYKSRTGA